jgi:hypothetical protein
LWIFLCDELSPDISVAWETVIAAFGMVSPVGPSVLKRPQRTFFTSMLPTMMFQTQMGHIIHSLS